MSHRHTIFTGLLAAALLLPAASFAADSPRAPCVLANHAITAVTPYRVEERVGRGTVSRLRGAQIFVRAEPGLTAEWLQLNLARHLTAMRGADMRNCALDVDDLRVQVRSAGPGFNVRLVARDSEQAKEVLRRAQLLLK